MQELIEWFNFSGQLTPEVYVKYIIFVSLFACMSRCQ